jgi:WhiB family transcriptional regulator, redox-sensing transcriptional regulator
VCPQVDPEIFFPPKGDPGTEARQICAGCPVRRECLAYAIEADDEFGIWGGLDRDEQRNLKRRMRRKQARTLAEGTA